MLEQRGDVHVRRPWEEAVPSLVRWGSGRMFAKERERETRGLLVFISAGAELFQRHGSPCKEKRR